MNTCEDHGTNAIVIYLGNTCPACEAEENFRASEDTVATLRQEIADLKAGA